MFSYVRPNVKTGSLMRRMLSTGEIKTVGVVGLGLMGHGIAQMSAAVGYNVIAVESSNEALANGMKRIEGSLGKVIAKDVKKGKIASEAEGKAVYDKAMGRITTSIDVSSLKDCDLIVEAIIEDEKIKCDFYRDLGPKINPSTIFASNTSSLPITNMAEASGRPDKFVGLHFFNPVQLMRLVEVIRTKHTDPKVFDTMTAFGKSLGKTAVSCSDTPGFIVNRLLIPYLTQAQAMVDRGDATVKDIDISMQLGAGHPMGPLHLSDYVGLDICYNVLKGWQQAYPDEDAFFIPACLEQKVKEGNLGRKTGKGFYHWDGDKALEPVDQ